MQLPSIWAGYQELCILIASPFLRDSENLTHLFPLPHCARPARLQRALWLDFDFTPQSTISMLQQFQVKIKKNTIKNCGIYYVVPLSVFSRPPEWAS